MRNANAGSGRCGAAFCQNPNDLTGERPMKRLSTYLSIIATILGSIFLSITANRLDDLTKAYPWALSCLSLVALAAWGIRHHNNKRLLIDQFDIFAATEKLDPKQFGFEVVAPNADPADLTHRPYIPDSYISRQGCQLNEDGEPIPSIVYDEQQMLTILEEGCGLLLVGPPTDGKSRTLLELSRRLKGYIAIRQGPNQPSKEAIELLRGKRVLCIFDDTNSLIEGNVDLVSFYRRVSAVAAGPVPVAAACRDGVELVAMKMQLSSSPARELFNGIRYRLALLPATEEEKDHLKKLLMIDTKDPAPTLGSICMRRGLSMMEQRFSLLNPNARHCFWAIQLLTVAGVPQITHARINIALTRVFEKEQNLLDVQECVSELGRNSFLKSRGNDPVIPEAAYAAGPVSGKLYRQNKNLAEDIPRLAAALVSSDDGEAAYHIGIKLQTLGSIAHARRVWLSTYRHLSRRMETNHRIAAANCLFAAAAGYRMAGNAEYELKAYRILLRRFEFDTNQDISTTRGMSLHNIGTRKAMKKDWKKAREAFSSAVRASELLSIGSDHRFIKQRALQGLAACEKALNRNNEAAECLLQARRSLQSSIESPIARTIRAEAGLAIGDILLMRGNRDEARKILEEVASECESDPRPEAADAFAQASIRLASGLLHDDSPQQMIARTTEALGKVDFKNPSDQLLIAAGDAYAALIGLLGGQGRVSEALDAWHRMQSNLGGRSARDDDEDKLHASFLVAQLNIGTAYLHLGQISYAEMWLFNAAASARGTLSSEHRTTIAEALLGTGQCHFASGDHKLASAFFDTARRLLSVNEGDRALELIARAAVFIGLINWGERNWESTQRAWIEATGNFARHRTMNTDIRFAALIKVAASLCSASRLTHAYPHMIEVLKWKLRQP